MNKNQQRWFIDQRYPDQLISEDQIKQEYGKQVADGSIDPAEKNFQQYLSDCMEQHGGTLAEVFPQNLFPSMDLSPQGKALTFIENIFENIFEITCVATRLLDSNEIAVDDSRVLFNSVVQFALDFEKQFDPENDNYLLEIEDYAERRLLSEFRPED